MLKNLNDILRGEAEHALVRLYSDELSEAEAAAVHNRAKVDPEYRRELHGVLAALDSFDRVAGDPAIEELASDYRRLLRKRQSRQRLGFGLAAGAALATGLALAVFAPWTGDRHLQQYFTRIGEQQTIQLPDGSVVTLNTGSELVVDYSESARRLALRRGEAYFDVTKDPKRPFTVDLGMRSVTAMGTEFNIRKNPDHYQIAVIEGTVALSPLTDALSPSPPLLSANGEAVVISAPRQYRVEEGWVVEIDESRDELRAFRPESMDRYRDWRNGLLEFYEEPLSKVVEELNRYSRKKILIEDPSVVGIEVYSVVHVQDIDYTLKSLEQVLPVKVTWHYDRIEISAVEPNGSNSTRDRR